MKATIQRFRPVKNVSSSDAAMGWYSTTRAECLVEISILEPSSSVISIDPYKFSLSGVIAETVPSA